MGHKGTFQGNQNVLGLDYGDRLQGPMNFLKFIKMHT